MFRLSQRLVRYFTDIITTTTPTSVKPTIAATPITSMKPLTPESRTVYKATKTPAHELEARRRYYHSEQGQAYFRPIWAQRRLHTRLMREIVECEKDINNARLANYPLGDIEYRKLRLKHAIRAWNKEKAERPEAARRSEARRERERLRSLEKKKQKNSMVSQASNRTPLGNPEPASILRVGIA
jgi:hypothetical protein